MKKLILSGLLALSSATFVPSAFAVSSFNATQIANVRAQSLEISDLVKNLYATRVYPLSEKNDYQKLPSIGMGSEKGQSKTLAVLHPIVTYKNANAETRYLVQIEKKELNEDNENTNNCFACSSKADLFIFKKLNNGQYQLVSRTLNDKILSGNYGEVGLDMTEVKEDIRKLGNTLVGILSKKGSFHQGTSESNWYSLFLSEDNYITVYKVAIAEESSEESSSVPPLNFDYDSEAEVIVDGSKYYPIKITYKGEKPNSNRTKIISADSVKVVKFDETKKVYK